MMPTSHPSRIVLGLDPGFDRVGYGIIDGSARQERMLAYGCVTTPKKSSLPDRLSRLADEVEAIIERYQPTLAGVEKLFFYNNAKTALDVSQARGVLLLILTRARIPILEFTPLQVKQTTVGYGNATKKQVQYMVTRLLCLSQAPQSDDAADALAIALCANQHHSLLV